jgi:hypothetical protein
VPGAEGVPGAGDCPVVTELGARMPEYPRGLEPGSRPAPDTRDGQLRNSHLTPNVVA